MTERKGNHWTLLRSVTNGIARRSVHVLVVVSAVIFWAVFPPSLAIAEPGITVRSRSQPENGIAAPNLKANRIQWVLENKIEGRALQAKAKDKLSKLSPEQIRLLDALAARIIKSDRTVASDIAFLVITTLIISS